MNSAKEINVKNRTNYFFDDMSIKNLDPNKIKIDQKSYKNILTYYISYDATNSVNSLYLIFNKLNGYIDERNENQYLTLVSTHKSKETLKKI